MGECNRFIVTNKQLITLMKLKQLESYLQDINVFEEPKIQFEQYPTSPHLASLMLYTAQTKFGDIEGKSVGDVGCGCGILSIAAAMLGASYNVGLDIDSDAIAIAQSNAESYDILVDFIQMDVTNSTIPIRQLGENEFPFDTVVMNPPFGTKGNWGIDMIFLQTGIKLARNAIYSLHKTSTREHIKKKAKEWGVEFQVIAELKFDIPASYRFHKRKSLDVEVDFIRLSKTPVTIQKTK